MYSFDVGGEYPLFDTSFRVSKPEHSTEFRAKLLPKITIYLWDDLTNMIAGSYLSQLLGKQIGNKNMDI